VHNGTATRQDSSSSCDAFHEEKNVVIGVVFAFAMVKI
jgi:hypothetical protein